jgi:flagellar biosynthetic protein FliQ
MSEAAILEIGRWAMITGLQVAGPLLAAALLSGAITSVILATTQVQEFTLTFVPKIVAIACAALLFGPWILRTLVSFATQLLSELPRWAP